MQVKNRTYIALRILASLILIFALFITYIGTVWFFDNLIFFEKIVGFTYVFLLILLILLRPKRSIIYTSIVIVSGLPAIYSFVEGLTHFNKSIDVLLPLSVLFSLGILYFLSINDVKSKEI